jgi:hypothetical protein
MVNLMGNVRNKDNNFRTNKVYSVYYLRDQHFFLYISRMQIGITLRLNISGHFPLIMIEN